CHPLQVTGESEIAEAVPGCYLLPVKEVLEIFCGSWILLSLNFSFLKKNRLRQLIWHLIIKLNAW
ncbi:MAG: hypothetical protein ACI934_001803, partial [Pseudohongiellaceae bacterium]